MSFWNKGYEKETELSKYVWKLKDKEKDFTIKLSVAAKASPYICSKHCDLCLMEKLLVNKAGPRTLLNKRPEIVSSKCRHHNKFTLKRFH